MLLKMSIWLRSSKYQFCFRFLCHLSQPITPQNFNLWYQMIVSWLCWHTPILMKNIRQKPYPQFLTVHDFGKTRWGVAYVLCVANCWSGGMWSPCVHWLNTDRCDRRCPIMLCADSVISMSHMICMQHLATARSEKSVLPIDHII